LINLLDLKKDNILLFMDNNNYQSVFKSIDPFHYKTIYRENKRNKYQTNILVTKFSLLIKGRDKEFLKEINTLLEQRLKSLVKTNLH
jgi:hypothetical protein